MRLRNLLLSVLSLPLLAACVNDTATLEVDGTREHVLVLMREQPYFWDDSLELSLVVARMPACMRRHPLGKGTRATKVELYQVPSGAYIVKVGKKMYATETQNCVNFAKLNEEPPEGLGQLIGTYREKKGELVFEKDPSQEEKPGQTPEK